MPPIAAPMRRRCRRLGLIASAFALPFGSQAAAPAAPERLIAHPAGPDSIGLTWIDRADNEDAFVLERRAGENGPWIVVDDTIAADSTQFLDSGLAPAGEYFYRLSARNIDGASPSNWARALTDDRPHGTRTLYFQNGFNAYAGAVDVGISASQPGLSNKGAYVWIDRDSAALETQALLRFDDLFGNEPHLVPVGARITRARLVIYLGTVGSGESKDFILFHRMLVPWDGNASWNAAPWGASGILYNGSHALATPDGSKIFSVGGLYYDVDITPSLQAWAATGAGEGWLLRTATDDGYAYYTTHNTVSTRRPALVVQYDTDPDNIAPVVAQVHGPADGAVASTPTVLLDLTVDDANGDAVEVVIHGRQVPPAEADFAVIILPDTQYYVSAKHGGNRHMFTAQTDWIVANRAGRNIAFVLHVGDIVEDGDLIGSTGVNNLIQWVYAAQSMYRLEDPVSTGLPEGIPYGVVVGNHDQQPLGDPDGTTIYYNQYFGIEHFQGRSYYGGHYGSDNDNYYQLYEMGSYKFISISLEFRTSANAAILEWADQLLKAHPDRRGIINTHYLMRPGNPGAFGPYGAAIYATLKDNPNLHLMVGGHITGEGQRTDTYNGNTVHSLLQDYQFWRAGGDGLLRILTFSPKHNEIRVQTYSPWTDTYETGEYSTFSLPYDLGTPEVPFTELARETVPAGSRLQHAWQDLQPGSSYDWYVEISDGRKTATGAARSFRVAQPGFLGYASEGVDWLDTGAFMGWLQIEHRPHVYSSQLDGWIYIDDRAYAPASPGVWTFLFTPPAP
jgi:hypothetical protein